MLTKIVRLFKDKRAVDAVVSNVILVGAVIVVGFAALLWAQNQSSSYTRQYSQDVSANINKLKERVVFEYIYYNSTSSPKNLKVFLMNCGTANGTTVQTAYVSYANNGTLISTFSSVTLRSLDGSSQLPNGIDVGQEGSFTVSTTLVVGTSYSVKILTGRESTFAGTFVA